MFKRISILLVVLVALTTGCWPKSPTTPAASPDPNQATNAWYREKVDRLEQQLSSLQKQVDALSLEVAASKYDNLRSHLDYTNGMGSGRIVTLYLWDHLKNANVLQPVDVLVSSDKELLNSVVDALIKGAPDAKLECDLGAHPQLLSASVKDGVAYLDFDSHFYDFQGGSGWASNTHDSIVYTITEIEGIDAVQVTVEGKPAVMHGLYWTEPRKRNATRPIADKIRYAGSNRPRQ